MENTLKIGENFPSTKIVDKLRDNESCSSNTKAFQIKQKIRIKEKKRRHIFILPNMWMTYVIKYLRVKLFMWKK